MCRNYRNNIVICKKKVSKVSNYFFSLSLFVYNCIDMLILQYDKYLLYSETCLDHPTKLWSLNPGGLSREVCVM